MTALDLTGRVFGQWTVEGRAGSSHGFALWWCRCACGRQQTVRGANLLHGQSSKCWRCRNAEVSRIRWARAA
jgi:hypothetical protein